MNRKDYAFITLFFLCISLNVFIIYQYKEYNSLFSDYKQLSRDYSELYLNATITERFRMYNPSLQNKSNYVNGVAFGSQYYCVWTKDRNESEVKETDLHENAHIYIKKDYKHFCG